MTEDWWKLHNDKKELTSLADDRIHDMGDITHMLPNAEGADLLTSIMEVKPLIEQRISSSLRASRHERLGNAMMHLIEGGGKRMRATLPWLVAVLGRYPCRSAGHWCGHRNRAHTSYTTTSWTMMKFVEEEMLSMSNTGCQPQSTQGMRAAIAFERLVMAENLGNEDVAPLVNRIAWMVRRVSEGQQLDIEFEDRLDVSEEDYLEMIEGKTAVMFWICAEIGARISGANEATVELMANWGKALGLCFQLMDDVIDVLSDSDTLGKPAGSDIAQGKRTLMIIHALRQEDGPVKDRLLAVLGKGDAVSQASLDDGLQRNLVR